MFFFCAVFRDAALDARRGKPDARMRRAAALSPEHLSACRSEHDRRIVQMPMSDFAESEQR